MPRTWPRGPRRPRPPPGSRRPVSGSCPAPVLLRRPGQQPHRLGLVEQHGGQRHADVGLLDGRDQVAGRAGGQHEHDHGTDFLVRRRELEALPELAGGDRGGGVDRAVGRAARRGSARAAGAGSARAADARSGRGRCRRRPPAPPRRRRWTRSRPWLPVGTGWVASSAAVSIRSPEPCTAMMPAWSNRASLVTSGVATAAVCEAAARCPAAERPASTASTGMLAATRRAVRRTCAGCRTTRCTARRAW